MDLSELTPELFEKADFDRHRRGYDMDQVDRFLEETGTALAQLLVKYRQLEERASHAEARLADAERRPDAAPAPAAPPSRPGMSEEEEVERASRTLLMARRTADATVADAEAEAATIAAEARSTADTLLSEARARIDDEREEATGEIRDTVRRLESRRDSLSAAIDALEDHTARYRRQLGGVAAELRSLADDPDSLGAPLRPDLPEEASGHTDLTGTSRSDDAHSDEAPPVVPDDPGPAGPAAEAEAAAEAAEETQAHDSLGSEEWGEGSWSRVAPEVVAEPTDEDAADEPRVVAEAEPATGQTNDRFLRELDEAVNEAPGDDAMSAFFQDDDDAEHGRFGWRR